jgi:HSP20 family protein
MSTVLVKRGSEQPVTREAMQSWEPMRRMRELMQWDPFAELATLGGVEVGRTFFPSFEIKEAKDAIIFKADLPGVKESDLEINMTGDRLTVTGRREMEEQEQNETYYLYERSYGTFTRSFTLPTSVDPNQIKAELRDGVLTIVSPKRPEAQPKRITVSSSGKTPRV